MEEKQEYPKHLYHRSSKMGALKFAVVESEADETALGEGWAESPAEFGIETHPMKPAQPVVADLRPVKK